MLNAATVVHQPQSRQRLSDPQSPSDENTLTPCVISLSGEGGLAARPHSSSRLLRCEMCGNGTDAFHFN